MAWLAEWEGKKLLEEGIKQRSLLSSFGKSAAKIQKAFEPPICPFVFEGSRLRFSFRFQKSCSLVPDRDVDPCNGCLVRQSREGQGVKSGDLGARKVHGNSIGTSRPSSNQLEQRLYANESSEP